MKQAILIADEKEQTQKENEGSLQSAPTSEKSIELSVIVPISERHDDLRELYLQYSRELATIVHAYEFIFVLDGPNHDTLQTLRTLKNEFPEIQVIILKLELR